MKKNAMKMVPGAASLILIIVILCMAVLEMLTLMSAISDDKLSARAIQVAQENFALKDASERSLASLTEMLRGCETPEAVEAALEGTDFEYDPDTDTVYWMESADVRTMECEVRLTGGTPVWTEHMLWTDMDSEW